MPLLQRILGNGDPGPQSNSGVESDSSSSSSTSSRRRSDSGSEAEGNDSTSQTLQSQSDGDQSSNKDQDDPDAEAVASLKLQIKRQKQSAKARAASLATRALRRLAKNAIIEAPKHKAEAFREDVRADNTLARPGVASGSHGPARRRRLRLLVSYLQGWVTAVTRFFRDIEDSDMSMRHSICSIILDDTNMRLSQVDAQVSQWKRSRVVSVMNICQTLVACYASSRSSASSTLDPTLQKVFTVPPRQWFACQKQTLTGSTLSWLADCLFSLARSLTAFKFSTLLGMSYELLPSKQLHCAWMLSPQIRL